MIIFPLLFQVFFSLFLHVYCVLVNMHACAYTCGGQRTMLGNIVRYTYHLHIFDTSSLWPGDHQLECLAKETQGTICFCLHILGIKVRPPCLGRQHFTYWAISLAPSFRYSDIATENILIQKEHFNCKLFPVQRTWNIWRQAESTCGKRGQMAAELKRPSQTPIPSL